MTTPAYPGNISIDQLQIQIQFAEQNDRKLVDCKVVTDKDKKPCTACEFEDVTLELGESLSPIFIVEKGNPKPDGTTTLLFSKIVAVNNSLVAVDFYR